MIEDLTLLKLIYGLLVLCCIKLRAVMHLLEQQV